MELLKAVDRRDPVEMGSEMHQFARELYPICRSITGDGLRRTLALIQGRVPMQVFEVPTGTKVFDWIVPKEWNIRDAYVKAPNGKRVVDFLKCNLHVMNYSVPVHQTMPLSALKKHLHTIQEQPEWIPYRTSYYREDWGFCLSHQQMMALQDG